MKQIPEDQVVARIQTENPWWAEPHMLPPSILEWTPRPYLDLLYSLVANRSVQRAMILLGPRRVGKTVLIHHVIQRFMKDGVSPRNLCYVSVDHPLYNGLRLEQILEAYKNASGVDYRTEECFVFFDEIQYLRDWEIHLKALVDRNKSARLIASGSAAAALRLKSKESGAGRFSDFMLPPLTFHEYLFLLGQSELVDFARKHQGFIEARGVATMDIEQLNLHFLNYLNFGGYPEVAFSKEIQQDPGRFVKSDIIDKVLLRDLPSLYGVQDVQELNYLFTTLAFNTADEISLEQLSTGSGVAKNTIKRYIDYLEAAFLVRIVHRVDRNAKRFKRANFFKVYLTNPSIRSALFAPVGANDEVMGSLVETAIFSQWFHSNVQLHYARWNKGEVDIVCLGPNQKAAWAIEAKWSDRYFDRPEELRSLLRFCHTQNLGEAMVTTRTKSGTIERENVTLRFMPASQYCYMLGFNLVHRRHILEGLSEKNGKKAGEQEAQADV